MARWPKPEAPEGGDEYKAFLRAADHIGKLGSIGKLTFTSKPRNNEASEYGAGLIIDVKLSGKKIRKPGEYAMTVKFSSGNYNRMYERYGDPSKWRGKTVGVETKKHLGKLYAAITDK